MLFFSMILVIFFLNIYLWFRLVKMILFLFFNFIEIEFVNVIVVKYNEMLLKFFVKYGVNL